MTGSATFLWVAILSLLLLAATVQLFLKSTRLRYLFLLFSLVFFGFINTTALAGPGWLEDIVLKVSEFGSSKAFYLIIAVLLLFTAIFGQVFCGWVCPMGAVQEFLHDFTKRQLHVPEKLDNFLGLSKYAFAAYLLLNAIFRHTKLHYLNPFFVVFNLGGPPLLVIAAFVLLGLSIFVYRPWCRWFCPFSAVFNLIGKISLFQIKTNERCTNCLLGERICRIGAIKVERNGIKRKTTVKNSRCIRCGECLSSCPRSGIELRFLLRKEKSKADVQG